MTPSPTRMPRRWPKALFWSVLLLTAVAAVLALAYLVGRPPGRGEPELLAALDRTLHRDEVAGALTVGLLVAAGWALRRAWLELLGWLPGRIDVEAVRVDGDLGGVDAERLTMELRRRLARRRLQSVAAVPGAPPSTDFVAVLGDVRPEPSSILAALGRLVRAAKPTHAYEVAATLTAHPEESRYDATVEVTRLPHQGISARTVSDTSWEDAIQRAADAVFAAVLPQTRLCRSPWTGWRRYAMDAEMVHAHERACRLTSERRYDEALDELFRALEFDPRNIDLRLQIGFVQEKLGLPLDAVAMYLSARTVVRDDDGRVYSWLARRERRASAWIARYRLAILLAGPNVAEQWRQPPQPGRETERDAQRAVLRRRVRDALRETLAQHRLVGPRGRAIPIGPPWTTQELDELLGDPPAGEDPFPLRSVLVQIACAELGQLGHEVRAWPRRPHASLSPAAIRLAGLLMDMRRDWIRDRVRHGADSRWRVDPDEVAARVEKARGRSRRWSWTEEYNAACIFAAPMLVATVEEDPERADRFAALARRSLERAMASATSAHIAARRDWVLSEDPDLAALRRHEQFKQFEAMYLPSATRTPRRPRSVQTWQMSRYTRGLIAGSAERWEQLWHHRARELGDGAVDRDALAGWLRDEEQAWRLVDRVAADHRHWRARVDLIRAMDRWSVRYGFGALDASVPPFDGLWIEEAGGPGSEGRDDDCDGIARRDIAWSDERLAALHDLLAGALQDGSVVPQAAAGALAGDRREVDGAAVAALCERQTDRWRELREWIAERPPASDGSPDGAADSPLARALRTESDRTAGAGPVQAPRTAPAPAPVTARAASAPARTPGASRRPVRRFGRGSAAQPPPGR